MAQVEVRVVRTREDPDRGLQRRGCLGVAPRLQLAALLPLGLAAALNFQV